MGELPPHALQSLRQAMSRHCGVERSESGLTALKSLICDLRAEHGDADALIAADFIVTGALNRCESRGGHFRTDCPQTATNALHTRLTLNDLTLAQTGAQRYQTPAE